MNSLNLTLSDDEVAAVAGAHERARTTVRQIKRTTLAHPSMTLDDAYRCQRAWVDLQIAGGAQLVGHKIGLTSRAMQRTMNIDEPDFGALLDYMRLPSGTVLNAADYCDPQLEVELAFVIGERIAGDNVTSAEVLAKTDYVVPALELIDARSFRTDPDDKVTRTIFDTVSDNAADAGVIVGTEHANPRELDLRWVGAIMKRNGVVEETGLAAGVLDDPLQGIVWLARRLAPYGVALEPGQLILSGSFTRPALCRAGDHFEVDYGPLGVVELTFR